MANSTTRNTSTEHSTSKSQSVSSSFTKNVLDEATLEQILSGLMGYMTDEEINAFAENLMRPQLNAGIEAAQQAFDTTKLSKEQEIENLAYALAQSVERQNAAYRQNMADVETAALARGMGRSSYTLDTLAAQGNALAMAVQQLTDENARQSAQIQQQITQAAQQNAQTQGRLNTDYAAGLAAKVQELREQQRREANQNYLTAVSAAMGQQTTGQQTTTGTTDTTATSTTTSASGGGGGGGGSRSSASASASANASSLQAVKDALKGSVGTTGTYTTSGGVGGASKYVHNEKMLDR